MSVHTRLASFHTRCKYLSLRHKSCAFRLFLLIPSLLLPAQTHGTGSKKGIVEVADAIVVNKADGDLAK